MKNKLQNGLENKFYIGLIITSILLLGVFFTSKLWMYDDNPVMQTPFNKRITGLDQTVLTLNKWEYNPEKELMEVVIETNHTGADMIRPTFTFTARERNQTEEFPVSVVFEDDNNIIVQIRNIPENFQAIGLIVQEHRDRKVLENEMSNRTSDVNVSMEEENQDEELTSAKPSEQIIIGDYREITFNNKLVTREAIEYEIENVEREITQVEQQIKSIHDEKIPLQNDLVEVLVSEIESLEMEIEFQTNEEQESSLRQIESKENTIKDAEKTIEDLESEIEELTEKHQLLHEKLDSVLIDNQEKAADDETEEDDGEDVVRN